MDLTGALSVRNELRTFAEAVGDTGPVTVVGGRTHWDVGGAITAGTTEVAAPRGIVEYAPAEMIVRCGAGTTVTELHEALAAGGQMTTLPERPGATVGGSLAVGHSGLRRLRFGPLRDAVLEATFVRATGILVKGGGPVVKNVTGFDVCRILVGSLGTLGLFAEVVLRCLPRPVASQWFIAGDVDPFGVHRALLRPSSIVWDGTSTSVLLEGTPAEVAAERALLPSGFTETEGPPTFPSGSRQSLTPASLRSLTGTFVAEIGIGTVHSDEPTTPAAIDPSTAALHQSLKDTFDPTGRLNPGRAVFAS